MGEDHYPQKRTAVRGICLTAGAVLAVAAAAALILTDDPRYLKAAVFAAVWACVLALLASGRPRRDGEMSEDREAELRHTYQLEIDREVAARREYELRLEVSMRRELENGLQQDLSEVRAQLGSLRKELAERLNGELRLERFAVQAESTRLTGDRQVLEQQSGRIGLERSENGARALESAQSYRGPVDGGTTSLPRLLGPVEAESAGNSSTSPPARRPSPTPRPVAAASVSEPDRREDSGQDQSARAAAEGGGPDPLFGPMPAGIGVASGTGSWPSGFKGPNLGGVNGLGSGASSSTGSWPAFGSTNNWSAGGYTPVSSGTGRYTALGGGTGRYARPSGTGRYRALSGPQVPWPADPSLSSGPTVAAGGASVGSGNQSSGSQSDGSASAAEPARAGRRHRRAAESETEQNSGQFESPNQQTTGGNESTAGRRRRRYRDDNEDNDVLSRMRQQR